MITMKDLSGEWTLKTFDIIKENGVKKSWGKNINGLLIYTLSGYMSVSINKIIENVEEDPQVKLDSILFYSGTYKIIDENIIHYVSNASDPARIGKNLIREAALSNNILTLTGQGHFGKAILNWQKIRMAKYSL